MSSTRRQPPTPGDVLQEWVNVNRGITQQAVADAAGVTRFSINQIINGHRRVVAHMALRLARITDTTPEYWLDLQRDVDLYLAEKRIGRVVARLKPVNVREDA